MKPQTIGVSEMSKAEDDFNKGVKKIALYGSMAALVFGLLIGAMTYLIITISKPANAGLWTSLSGAFADTVESKLFAIEAQGINIRGYVFENPVNKGRFCIATASSNGGGVTCDWNK